MTPPRIRTRSGRKPRARFHANWSPSGRQRTRRAVVRSVGILAGIVAVLAVGVNVYAVSFFDSLPSVRGLDSAAFRGDTIVLDRNGQQLADIGSQGDRRLTVPLDQVSPKIQQGTIAIEDRTFWTNPGFDTQAILRTAFSNFRAGGITGGASTLSQQLAKRLFLTPKQSLDRKLQELVLAYQLNQTYSKQQILQLYLNQSYYGEQQYGVEAAAQTYFKRSAKNVDLAQAAMLAGLPQAPDAYSPVAHLDLAKRRQKEVLDAMVREGYVTPQDAAVAYREHLDIYQPVITYKAPHFVGYVTRELQALGFKPGQEQLTVKTTLDLGKQQLAEQVVRENLQANLGKDRSGQLSSALVSMDPKTGQIIAYVGSPDVNSPGGNFDFVSQVPHNPGSSVKPFTYAVAIRDRKITMDTPIADSPSPYVVNLPGGEVYKPTNFDNKTHGTPPARIALASSLNIPAVKVELTVGVPNVVDFYRSIGIRPRAGNDPNAAETAYGPSLTLGGFPVTLLEEATGLSAFADLGVYHQPEAILQVTDLKGHVLYPPPGADPNRTARQVVDPGVAFIIASILNDDNNRAPIFGLNSPLHLTERHSAAKTGTTENYKDALTIGFTPDLATAVWVGDILDNKHVMSGGQTDAVYVAAPAWHRFMVAALKGVPDNWYPVPSDVTKVGNSYFLKDAQKVDHLPGDNPSPKPSPDFGIPNDPGGPRPLDNRCPKITLIPLPGCPTPVP